MSHFYFLLPCQNIPETAFRIVPHVAHRQAVKTLLGVKLMWVWLKLYISWIREEAFASSKNVGNNCSSLSAMCGHLLWCSDVAWIAVCRCQLSWIHFIFLSLWYFPLFVAVKWLLLIQVLSSGVSRVTFIICKRHFSAFSSRAVMHQHAQFTIGGLDNIWRFSSPASPFKM